MDQALPHEVEVLPGYDPNYHLSDVWVGVLLTLLILSCIGCICSCLLFHQFQQWKHSLLAARVHMDVENPHENSGRFDEVSLPSYTIVTGLPTYEEALEQMREVLKASFNKQSGTTEELAQDAPNSLQQFSLSQLSVSELLKFYRPDK